MPDYLYDIGALAERLCAIRHATYFGACPRCAADITGLIGNPKDSPQVSPYVVTTDAKFYDIASSGNETVVTLKRTHGPDVHVTIRAREG